MCGDRTAPGICADTHPTGRGEYGGEHTAHRSASDSEVEIDLEIELEGMLASDTDSAPPSPTHRVATDMDIPGIVEHDGCIEDIPEQPADVGQDEQHDNNPEWSSLHSDDELPSPVNHRCGTQHGCDDGHIADYDIECVRRDRSRSPSRTGASAGNGCAATCVVHKDAVSPADELKKLDDAPRDCKSYADASTQAAAAPPNACRLLCKPLTGLGRLLQI